MATEKREYVELRSEDVQEILGTPPGWLVRWGTTVVLLGCVMMIVVAWFVRYPDVVSAKVVLTTSNPPVEVVARADGRLAKVLVDDKDLVNENAVLGVLQTTAKYTDVVYIDSCVGSWQKAGIEVFKQSDPPRDLDLGEIQGEYAEFLQYFEGYRFGKSTRTTTSTSSISAINTQIHQLEQSIDFDRKAQRRVEEQLGPAETLYRNKKKLFEENIISQAEFEAERIKLADLERQKDQYGDNIIQKTNQIISLKRSISDVSFNREETEVNAETRLRNALNSLRTAVDKWKQTYLLTAPVAGQADFGNSIFSVNQYIKQGDPILTIVPPGNKGTVIGRLSLPVAGSGKVRPGQRVLLKLDSYPYHEFGALQGIVVTKSLVPKDDLYSIIVHVAKTDGKLISSYKKEIPFEQQLQGKAEIITDDKGLLERIGEQVFAGMR